MITHEKLLDTVRQWRWMVLLSCFFTRIFVQGIRQSFGVLLPTLEREFGSEVWRLGSMVAIICATGDFIGPLAGGLARMFTCRVLAMIGGVFMCIGMCLASQMTDMLSMSVCLVVFCGPGLGFVNDPSSAVLGKYFPKNYGSANGFSFLGSSVALTVFGPLTQYLVDIYGWRGALLLIGGLFFHMTVCGALLKPLPANDGPEKRGLYSVIYDSEEQNGENGSKLESNCCYSAYDSFHLAIFKDPLFYVTVVITSTIRFVQMGWTIYLVPNAVSNGIPPLRATLVATVGGIGDTIGKVIPGVVLWKELAGSKTVWLSGMVILSMGLIMNIVSLSFVGMLVIAFFQGLGLGISISLNNVVFKEVFGMERLVNTMGWIRFLTGGARILGGFVPGWIYKLSGSYNYAFLTLGCVQAFGILVLIIGYRYFEGNKRQENSTI